MAIWPILMNWQTISSILTPAAQCFGAKVDIQDLARRFLATWTGSLLAALVIAAIVAHILYNTWKIGRSVVLNTWSTKCSVSEDLLIHDCLIKWLAKHPSADYLKEFTVPPLKDDTDEEHEGVDFPRDDKTMDIKELVAKAVSYELP